MICQVSYKAIKSYRKNKEEKPTTLQAEEATGECGYVCNSGLAFFRGSGEVTNHKGKFKCCRGLRGCFSSDILRIG